MSITNIPDAITPASYGGPQAATQTTGNGDANDLAIRPHVLIQNYEAGLPVRETLPFPVTRPDLAASGTLTAVAQVVRLALAHGQATWTGQLAGTFNAGTTIVTEYSTDGGATWESAPVLAPPAGSAPVSSFVGGAQVNFRASCPGYTHVRVRCTVLQVSDSVAVTLTASAGANLHTNAAQDGVDAVGTNAGTQAGSTTVGVGTRGWLSTLVGLFQTGLAKVQTARGAKVQTAPTIGTSSTLALATNAARKEALLTNPSTNTATLYLGVAGVSSASYATYLLPGDTYIDDASSDAWYAASSAGSVTLLVCEVA